MKHWTLGILTGAALLFTAVPAVVASPQPDNAIVAEQVRKSIVKDPFYTIFDNVAFELRDGTVELTGEVYRPVLKRTIEKGVAHVAGVNTVVNNIEVLPLSSHDDWIRLNLARRLFGNQVFTRYAIRANPPIHIVVKNGNVSLEGVVHTDLEKNFAGIIANGTHGVFSVTNNLRTDS